MESKVRERGYKEIDGIENILIKKDEEIESLRMTIEKIREKNEKLIEENKRYWGQNRRMALQRNQFLVLQNQYREITNSIKAYQKQITKLNYHANNLQNQVMMATQLKQQYYHRGQKLIVQIKNLQNRYQKQKVQKNYLLQQNNRLTQQIQTHIIQNSHMEQTIKKLELKVKNIDCLNKKLNSHIFTLQQKQTNLCSQLHKYKNLTENYLKERDQYALQIQKAKLEISN